MIGAYAESRVIAVWVMTLMQTVILPRQGRSSDVLLVYKNEWLSSVLMLTQDNTELTDA